MEHSFDDRFKYLDAHCQEMQAIDERGGYTETDDKIDEYEGWCLGISGRDDKHSNEED